MHAPNQTGGAVKSAIRPVFTVGCRTVAGKRRRGRLSRPCNFYLQNTDFYVVLGITLKLPGDRHVLQPGDALGERRMCTE